MRRNSVPLSSYVNIREYCTCIFSQDRYFSLVENKVAFIQFLSRKLESDNITVVNCSGEADTKVVSSAIAFAQRNEEYCVVVADDTDIAVCDASVSLN